MTKDPMLIETAAKVLDEALNGSYFNISGVRQAAELLEVDSHSAEIDALRKFHCVTWAHMAPGLRERILADVCHALSIEKFQAIFQQSPSFKPKVVAVVNQPVKEGLLKRLGVVK